MTDPRIVALAEVLRRRPPRRAGGGRRMTRCLAAYLGAALVAAWAILRAWDHLRGPRPEPPPLQEPDDGVQPADVYLVSITAADGRGTFSRN